MYSFQVGVQDSSAEWSKALASEPHSCHFASNTICEVPSRLQQHKILAATGAEQRVVTNFGTRQRRWLSRWNEWVLLVCDMEKYKRPALQQEPNVYLEPKWRQCPQCVGGLELIGPAHEELETPEAVPCGRPRGRCRGRPRGGPRGTGRQAWRHALSRWPKGYGS